MPTAPPSFAGGAAGAQGPRLRPVPHRHAPARRRRPHGAAPHRRAPRQHAGGGDHGVRLDRERGGRAEGRRLRLPRQADQARAAAPARDERAEAPAARAVAPRWRSARRRPPGTPRLLGEIRGDAARARDDRQARALAGAGVHHRRVGQRQGSRRAPDPHGLGARRRRVRRGQLRRDPREPDGKRVLRLQEGRLHRRRRATSRATCRRRRRARSSWTRWATCRSRCR